MTRVGLFFNDFSKHFSEYSFELFLGLTEQESEIPTTTKRKSSGDVAIPKKKFKEADPLETKVLELLEKSDICTSALEVDELYKKLDDSGQKRLVLLLKRSIRNVTEDFELALLDLSEDELRTWVPMNLRGADD